MDFDFNLDELKEKLSDLFYQNKSKIFAGIFGLLTIFAVIFTVYKIDYSSRLKSSDSLIEYIYGENEDFISKKHKKGYAMIADFVKNKKDPKVEKFDEFANLDEFVLKNVFYFAKRLYFGYKDDFYMFFESNKNPWSKLFLITDIFYGEKDSDCVKQKDDYLISFLIGKGMQC